MARSKDPEHYPRTFLTMAEGCALHGKEYTLEFKTWREALSIQQRFIAWVSAMRRVRDAVNDEHREPITAYEKTWCDALALAHRTAVWVQKHKDGTSHIKFENKESSALARLLESATVTQGEVTPTQKAEADAFFTGLLNDIEKEKGQGLGIPSVVKPLDTLSPEAKERLAGYGNRRVLKDGTGPGDKDE